MTFLIQVKSAYGALTTSRDQETEIIFFMKRKWRSMRSRSDWKKLERIRLMSSELEAQRQFAIDRTRSIDSKAAFLVVAGGLLAAQTLPTLAQGGFALALAVLRLVLAFGVTLLATMALWPLKLKELGPDEFVRKWINSCEPTAALEDYILEVKARTIVHRNSKNESRARLLKAGFIVLVAGIIVAIVAGSVQVF